MEDVMLDGFVQCPHCDASVYTRMRRSLDSTINVSNCTTTCRHCDGVVRFSGSDIVWEKA